MKIAKEQHFQHNWRVGSLAADFELLDVWEYPILADERRGESFSSYLAFIRTQQEKIIHGRSLAGFLFGLRKVLGRVFGWDQRVNTLPIPGCRETTLRDRLGVDERSQQPWAQATDAAEQPSDFTSFRQVYRLEHEALEELSNSTVHALMHTGWVHKHGSFYAPQMAVYVKSRGILGRLYMGLISPLRHYIVYPAMMRAVGRAWATRSRAQP